MNNSTLHKIYNQFVKKLSDTGKNQIHYDVWWRYFEYTEWYWCRENHFKKRVDEMINKPYFKNVFLIVTSAILSSSNEEQFLDILDRYLSRYFSEKTLKEWEDIFVKKTYIRAHLDFINDSYLKYKFLLEKWNWWIYDNSALNLNDNPSIISVVEYVHDKVEKVILNNNYWMNEK